SRQPMLAAAMPFPSEETTPPVTKMYLAMNGNGSFKQLRDALEVLGGVHAEGFIFGFGDPDRITVFESPQLFQSLGLLQRANRKIGVLQQKIPPIYVQTNVLESRHTVIGGRRRAPITNIRD